MTRWHLSPAAHRDLTNIWLYTEDRWGSDQAEAYILQIEHDLTAAANGSPLAQPFDDFWRIRSGSHLCIFRKRTDGDIDVIRILHERMDVETQLGE